MATYQPVRMKTINQTAELPETKRKLVDAGVSLMRKQGYNATTVDDICSAAGVTKGGFFHYFKSKEDIAKAAVVRFREGKRQDFDNAHFRKLADPLDRVFGRLDFAKAASRAFWSIFSERTNRCCASLYFRAAVRLPSPSLRCCVNSLRFSISRTSFVYSD